MKPKDVTSHVSFTNNDDECLSITECSCGREFDAWDFVISIYADTPDKCPKCGKKFYFSNEIRIWQI